MQPLLRKPVCKIYLVYLSIICMGCSVNLAPAYDKAIIDGLTVSSQSVMHLLASISGGTAREDYPTRKETYNRVIGNIDALKIQAETRPMPESKYIAKANSLLAAKGIPVISGTAPSAIALDNISRNLFKMRDTDRQQGLTSFEVEIFKGNIIIYLDQAFTYERFLKR